MYYHGFCHHFHFSQVRCLMTLFPPMVRSSSTWQSHNMIVHCRWFQQDGFNFHCKIPHNQKLEGKTKVKLFCFIWIHRTNNLGSIKNWMGPYQPTPFSKLRSSYSILRFFRGPFSGSCWRFLGLGSFVQRRLGTQKFPPKTTARSWREARGVLQLSAGTWGQGRTFSPCSVFKQCDKYHKDIRSSRGLSYHWYFIRISRGFSLYLFFRIWIMNDHQSLVHIWVFPQIGVPPNYEFHNGFPSFSPSILGVFPLFLETPIYRGFNDMC